MAISLDLHGAVISHHQRRTPTAPSPPPWLPSIHSLLLVTPDLAASAPSSPPPNDDDPFLPAGFVSAFSAFSLERHPVLARSACAFSGHLAELERALAIDCPASSTPDPAGAMVSVESLRAYLQIVDVASILRLDRDIADYRRAHPSHPRGTGAQDAAVLAAQDVGANVGRPEELHSSVSPDDKSSITALPETRMRK